MENVEKREIERERERERERKDKDKVSEKVGKCEKDRLERKDKEKSE